jgi:CHASE3 domain sensor protein
VVTNNNNNNNNNNNIVIVIVIRIYTAAISETYNTEINFGNVGRTTETLKVFIPLRTAVLQWSTNFRSYLVMDNKVLCLYVLWVAEHENNA